MAVGPHTVDGSSCSGLAPSNPNYPLAYAGAANGYVVSNDAATITLTTTAASQAYGDEGATTFTATVDTGNGESLPAPETVTIDVGTTSCPATLTPDATGGKGGCQIGNTALGVGATTASASYGGDSDLSGSGPATTPFTVTQDSTSITLTTTAASQAYGDEGATTFTATVDTGNGESLPAPETVTIDVGTTSCPATLTPDATGGKGGCQIGNTALGVGATTASASYGGDSDLSGSGPATTPFTVTQDSTSITLTTTAASQAYGDEGATTFTATVDTGNGESLPAPETVTIDVGTTSCPATLTPDATGGKGGCQIGNTALGVGATTASASYGGDSDLSGSGPATTPFTVTQDSTSITLTTTAASQAYGDEGATTFTATVDTGNGESLPAPETVTIDVGTTSCPATLTPDATGGKGGCQIGNTALGVGATTASASYGGDSDLSGSGPATTPFTVISPSSIEVTVSGTQTYGGGATFTGTESPPAGVTVSGTLVCTTVDGGVSIAGGPGAGAHTVDGSSCGGLTSSDPNYPLAYVGSDDGFVVTRDSASITLSKSTRYLAYGDEGATTFTATVDTGNGESLPAPETVTIDVGTASCLATLTPDASGGKGGCSIGADAVGVGPTTASASYGGDTDLTGSSPATTAVPVTLGATDVTSYSCTVPGVGVTTFPVVVSESPAPPSSIDEGGTLQTTFAAQVTVPASVIGHYLSEGATSLTVSSQTTSENGRTPGGIPSPAVSPDTESAAATNLPQTDPTFQSHAPYAFATSYNPVIWQTGPGTGVVDFTPGAISLVATFVIHGTPTTVSIGCSNPSGVGVLDSTTVDPPPPVPTFQVPSPTPPLQSQVSPGTDGGWAVVISNTSTATVTGLAAQVHVTDGRAPATYDLTAMVASATTGCTSDGPGALDMPGREPGPGDLGHPQRAGGHLRAGHGHRHHRLGHDHLLRRSHPVGHPGGHRRARPVQRHQGGGSTGHPAGEQQGRNQVEAPAEDHDHPHPAQEGDQGQGNVRGGQSVRRIHAAGDHGLHEAGPGGRDARDPGPGGRARAVPAERRAPV